MHGGRENPAPTAELGPAPRFQLAPSTAQFDDSGAMLDRLLALLERWQLSASELRVLVALVERDQPVSELARRFRRRPSEVRRLGERLYARGLLRWHHEAPTEEPVLGITRAGLALVRPLLNAADLPRAA